MTAKQIEYAIVQYFDWRKNIIVPNIAWGLGLHECDVLIMSSAGYLTEVEIKISLSDLKADFNKGHAHDGKGKIKYFYYAMPASLADREDVIALIPIHAGIFRCSPSVRYSEHLVSASKARPASARTNARPLSEKEKFDLVRLGTMRIWNLKRKILMKP